MQATAVVLNLVAAIYIQQSHSLGGHGGEVDRSLLPDLRLWRRSGTRHPLNYQPVADQRVLPCHHRHRLQTERCAEGDPDTSSTPEGLCMFSALFLRFWNQAPRKPRTILSWTFVILAVLSSPLMDHGSSMGELLYAKAGCTVTVAGSLELRQECETLSADICTMARSANLLSSSDLSCSPHSACCLQAYDLEQRLCLGGS